MSSRSKCSFLMSLLGLLAFLLLAAVIALVVFVVISQGSSPFNRPGITLKQVDASGFVFDCRLGGTTGNAGNVVLLHGFPENSTYFEELVLQLGTNGYRSLACDQRGYSPGASPGDVSSYLYSFLRDDVFALADAVGFDTFHLVGHDHGALLGWYSTDGPQGRHRVLSITGMSVPHPDAFSVGLYGAQADLPQQVGSQYFSIFVMNNSASLAGDLLFNTLGVPAGFTSATAFQKPLWWYNGVFDEGALAMPPQFTAEELTAMNVTQVAALREAFGINANIPIEGAPQTTPTGNIPVPCLYVCGRNDTFILCNRPYALRTEEYCTAGYTYLEVDCGHDLLHCGNQTVNQQIIDGVIAHLKSAYEYVHAN